MRVRIEASGLCHTDIHAARGDWPIKPCSRWFRATRASVSSTKIGVRRVRPLRIGQRVAIPWLGGADGTCEFCVSGQETYCLHPTFTGYTVDGGYREFSIADADYVGVVPEGFHRSKPPPSRARG